MNRYISKALLFIPLLATLVACVSTAPPQQEEIQVEQQLARFDAWDSGLDRHNNAVRLLVTQSDSHIGNGQYDQAANVLERSLRIDNRVAAVWSRLAWLAIESQHYKRAQNLLTRSNSLTTDVALLKLNWQLYLDASDYANDSVGVERATQNLDKLY